MLVGEGAESGGLPIESEVGEALEFAARVAVGEAARQPVYPLSARAALAGGTGTGTGFAEFWADLAVYLDQGPRSRS